MKRLAIFVLFLLGTGCGGDSVFSKDQIPSKDQLDRIDLAMSETELVKILGPGKVVSSPPTAQPVRSDRLAEITRPSQPSGFNPVPGMVWRMWGNDRQNLCLGFVNGKVVASQQNNLEADLKQGGVTTSVMLKKSEEDAKKARLEAEEFHKKAQADIDESVKRLQRESEQRAEEMELRFRRDTKYSGQLHELGNAYREYAKTHPTLTPSDATPLETVAMPISAAMKKLLASGEIIVVWDAPKGSKVIAYPRMALEANARYLDGEFEHRECTPEQLKTLLEMK